MNNKYFETDNNKYIVIENDKDISVVKSNKDIEEILNLENEIELLEQDLKRCNENIENTKVNINLKRKFNNFLFKTELIYILFVLITNIMSSNFLFFSVLISYTFLEVIVTSILGSINKNKENLHKYKIKREVVLANIDASEITLGKKKYANQYEKDTIVSLINEKYEALDNDLEVNKVKKLTLKKPNER